MPSKQTEAQSKRVKQFMNFANFLTISRVILILPVLFFISEESGLNNWLALFLFVLAGVTDNLDGYIAR